MNTENFKKLAETAPQEARNVFCDLIKNDKPNAAVLWEDLLACLGRSKPDTILKAEITSWQEDDVVCASIRDLCYSEEYAEHRRRESELFESFRNGTNLNVPERIKESVNEYEQMLLQQAEYEKEYPEIERLILSDFEKAKETFCAGLESTDYSRWDYFLTKILGKVYELQSSGAAFSKEDTILLDFLSLFQYDGESLEDDEGIE